MEFPEAQKCLPHTHLKLDCDENRLLANVRAGLSTYCSRSLLHFALYIKAEPFQQVYHMKGPNLKVCFNTYSRSVHRICRLSIGKGRSIRNGIIQVREGKRWVCLNTSLQMHFPVSNDDYVSENTMREYWDSNGKTLPWARFPTELKENVLQFCVCKPHSYSKLPKPGAYEVIGQLGDWCGLLHVSRQVRALTIRLATIHNDHYPGGLSLVSESLGAFRNSFNRLGWYFQVKEDNSIPTNARTEALAKCYMNYPRQYPQLSRFALMRHGIRKVHIQFDWLDALYFFKVSIGSLDQWRPKLHMTYEAFEKLPNLDGLHISLPNRWLNHEPTFRGPQLFRGGESCPRILHRMIYERIATELASYKGLSVSGFIDVDEAQTFREHREAAILSQKVTVEELKDLYAECDGGVNLDFGSVREIGKSQELTQKGEQATPWTLNWGTLPSRRQRYFEPSRVLPEDSDIFPPQCFCDVPCFDIFFLLG